MFVSHKYCTCKKAEQKKKHEKNFLHYPLSSWCEAKVYGLRD